MWNQCMIEDIGYNIWMSPQGLERQFPFSVPVLLGHHIQIGRQVGGEDHKKTWKQTFVPFGTLNEGTAASQAFLWPLRLRAASKPPMGRHFRPLPDILPRPRIVRTVVRANHPRRLFLLRVHCPTRNLDATVNYERKSSFTGRAPPGNALSCT